MKLYNTVKDLILELASTDTLINSIRNKDVIVIYYDGDEPGGRGLREIEPVCLGVSKSGNKVLRAWEREGASHRGYLGIRPIPGWRLFRSDKITSVNITGDKFNSPRPNYNPNGDKSMLDIIINVNFDTK